MAKLQHLFRPGILEILFLGVCSPFFCPLKQLSQLSGFNFVIDSLCFYKPVISKNLLFFCWKNNWRVIIHWTLKLIMSYLKEWCVNYNRISVTENLWTIVDKLNRICRICRQTENSTNLKCLNGMALNHSTSCDGSTSCNALHHVITSTIYQNV